MGEYDIEVHLSQLRIEVHSIFFTLSTQHPELMDTFLVGNHCHSFRKIIE